MTDRQMDERTDRGQSWQRANRKLRA